MICRTPQRRGLGRIAQMHPHPRGDQLLDHIPPPGTALQRELGVSFRAMLTPANHAASCG